MSPSEYLSRSADGMTGPEWAWSGYALQVTLVGLLALPAFALSLASGSQTAFGVTAGTAAGCVLIAFLQAVYYAVKNRDL